MRCWQCLSPWMSPWPAPSTRCEGGPYFHGESPRTEGWLQGDQLAHGFILISITWFGSNKTEAVS
jgi:hypothetical protein